MQHGLVAVVRSESHLVLGLCFFNRNATIGFGDRARALRVTGFEQLGHPGKTLGDVISRRGTTRVEGTHGELCSRLTNGLGGDNSDGLTQVNGDTRGQ